MRILLLVATGLQVAAIIYCSLLLRRHPIATRAWLWLMGVLLSMLVWRIVLTTGATPGPLFNTSIAISGSVCAVLAMFFFGREVARRQQAEAERDHLLTSERAARSQAEQASRIKDEFMATLSHELRSPLAAVLGWCAMLRKSSLPSEAQRAIDTIERNARIQTRLVDDLLDATRMQSGSLHLENAPVSLDAAVAAAIEDIRPRAEAKRLTVRYECRHPSVVVHGDASRLQQIASNLLVNAVKFTPEGRAVNVSLAIVDASAELVVADEGMGIDADFVPQLFQRFRQADTGNARRHGGLGLGLSIVFNLVQLHGGEIRAHSDGPGKGATFIVRLPIARSSPVLAETAALEAEAVGPFQAIQDLRILVVDDEADVRGAVAGLLERAGAIVLALESGATIETALLEFRPDVLVLDISMPGEDGYSLIRRIRELSREHGGQVPAVSLTAHARVEDRQRAIDSGFQAHLPKPLNLPSLVSTIHGIIGPRKQGSDGLREPERPVSPESATRAEAAVPRR